MNKPSSSWFITHGIGSGVFLTYDMFKTDKNISYIDECHYTSDAAIVYTYLHFVLPISRKAIETFIEKKKENGVIPFQICGYEAIVSSADLTDHVGFKILLHHYQTNHPSFRPCTSGNPRVFRGKLWQADHMSRLQQCAQTRSRELGQFCKTVLKDLARFNARAEFDVVKKRKQMDSPINQDDETNSDALARFQDFESHVIQALEPINRYDMQNRHEELLLLEKDLKRSDTVEGGVYVVKSKSVTYPKIGATRMGITERLKGLQRYVPSPFKLIFWVPSATPFKLESEIHRHFHSFRIREGANTEFFDLDLDTIGVFLKQNYEGVVDNSQHVHHTNL